MSFIQEVRNQNIPIWDACAASPFVQQLQQGTLPFDCFRKYIIQDSIYLKHYARIWGKVIYHAATLRDIQLYYSILNFVTDAESAVRLSYLKRFGMTDEDIERIPPLPETKQYIDFLFEVAERGNECEILMAALPCMVSYSYIFRKIAAKPEAIWGGCTMVQLREKDMSSSAFYDQAIAVKRITDQYGIPLIINDRIDIALAVHANEVHLGQSDLPAKIARTLIGTDVLLGISVTSVKEAKKAVADGADYLGIGAMYPSRTKPDAEHVSMEELQEIRKAVNLPIVVIGGICKKNAALFRPMGVDGLAVVSAVISSPDIRKAAAELKALFCGAEQP